MSWGIQKPIQKNHRARGFFRPRFALAMALFGASLSCASPTNAQVQPSSVPKAELEKLIERGKPGVLEHYRWFHQHPEVSNQEHQTSKHLAEAMSALGARVQTGIGGTGFVAVLSGQKPGKGPFVLYRADMDALPVTEQTGLAYASKNSGVMHACGHDVHMAVAVGAMQTMAALRKRWSGTVLFVAQPSEELGAGAERMIEDPKFKELLAKHGTPRLALALHDSADLPAGSIGISGGYVTANVDSVDITFFGKGGHGAKPHEAIDPVVMASEAVLALQTIVSRRIPADKRAVVTVGKFSAGTKHNIIPPSAELLLTVRSYEDEIRQQLLAEIKLIAEKIAEAYHAPQPPSIKLDPDFTPSGRNDEEWALRLEQRFKSALGKDKVVPNPPTMVGEDFAQFGRKLGIPGVMWRLGAANPQVFANTPLAQLPGLHSDKWAPDAERTLPVGVLSVVLALLEGLGR
jgi:hippurate hydrolase